MTDWHRLQNLSRAAANGAPRFAPQAVPVANAVRPEWALFAARIRVRVLETALALTSGSRQGDVMDPETLIRAWFREVWDEGHEDAIDRFMTPDALVHGLGEAPIRGPEGFKPYFRAMRAALGDLEVRVVRTVVEGDMVAAHCHVVARHAGEGLGGPPTNRPVDFFGMTMARVVKGRLVEGWNVFDFLTMYQQLGWVKLPGK